MSGNDTSIPTDWPRNLNPPPAMYFHRAHLTDAAKLRAQALTRYRKDPAAWIAKVREWQARHPEYFAAYQAWWWRQNRSEERLAAMRAYTAMWRAKKRAAKKGNA
jgi:hypothetical protein